MLLSIGSYASVAAIGAAGAGAALPLWISTLIGLITALIVSALGIVLAAPVFHVVDHASAAVRALSALYATGILAIGIGLHTFLKRWTTLAMMVLFVMLNFTTSGGIFRPDLQNGFFGSLHASWTGAGFVEGTRTLLYFGHRAGFCRSRVDTCRLARRRSDSACVRGDHRTAYRVCESRIRSTCHSADPTAGGDRGDGRRLRTGRPGRTQARRLRAAASQSSNPVSARPKPVSVTPVMGAPVLGSDGVGLLVVDGVPAASAKASAPVTVTVASLALVCTVYGPLIWPAVSGRARRA